MSEEHKLDIFDELRHISTRDVNWYVNMSDDLKKQIVPFVLMKWLCGSSSQLQTVFLNEYVNPYVFSLSQHKLLLYKLLVACCDGKNKKYTWMKKPKTDDHKFALRIISEYYGCSLISARDYLSLLSIEALKDFANQLGYTDKEIKDL